MFPVKNGAPVCSQTPLSICDKNLCQNLEPLEADQPKVLLLLRGSRLQQNGKSNAGGNIQHTFILVA